MSFPPVPPEVKSIAHFLKVASEHDDRNVVVSYWARMYACQRAMAIVPGKKPPAVTQLLVALMNWMEKTKKENAETEGIVNETTAHALIEEYALQLFTYGDAQDRAAVFNKNTIKAFYTAGILMDILEQFGTLSEDIHSKRKYAKWKAAYIHNCLKIGDIPIPGAPDEHLDNVVHRSDIEDKDEEHISDEDSDGPTSSNVSPPARPSPDDQLLFKPVIPQQPQNVPQPQPRLKPSPTTPSSPFPSNFTTSLSQDQIVRTQKLCKFAISALDYSDTKAAIENLNKAMNLLTKGSED